jgi:malonyl-CoA O-methyltransferase
MPSPAEKRKIRQAFSRAAASYDRVARVQRRICDALLTRLEPSASGIALDAGCGTAYALPALTARGQQCIALDHAIGMLSAQHSAGICADIEQLPLRDACVEQYFSSLAWQWINAEAAIHEAARVLRPGGHLAVATLAPDSLAELRQAMRQADGREHVRSFAASEHYAAMLQAAGFSEIRIERQVFQDHADSLLSLLRDLKALGAHTLDGERSAGFLPRAALQRAAAFYEQYRVEAGLPLSYDVVFLLARRSS